MRTRTTPALVVLVAVAWTWFLAPAAAAAAPPALTSDATGPLFTAALLEPGAPLERCLRLSWTDARDAVLGVSADVTGPLASYLDVTVQSGTGGDFRGCGGFVPADAGWSGTLASLTASHPAPARQASLARVPVADGSATVRVTVTVRQDDRAQALRATGALVLSLVEDVPPPAPTTPPAATPAPTDAAGDTGPTPAPGRTVAPTPPAAPTASAAPGAVAAAGPTAGPGSDATAGADPTTPAAGSPGPGAGPAGPGDGATVVVPLTPGSGPADDGWLPDAIEELFTTTAVAAGAVTRGVGWTFWTAPPVILFLLLQNRIDQRDPKLAEAPAQAVPGLPFDEPYLRPAAPVTGGLP